jgi:putative flippase GtrA
LIRTVLRLLPAPVREVLLRHRELLKFVFVGGTAFIVDTAIFLGLKDTVLESKPVTAKVISTLVATIVSYILNREWSFRTRGGRERHHEAGLFFLISAIGLVLTAAPLGLSRYGLHLETPYVSRLQQEIADITSAQIIGTLIAMVFRWWAFRRFVFPHPDARPRRGATSEPVGSVGSAESVDEIAAGLLGDPWPFEEPDDILDGDSDEIRSTK